MKRTLLKMAITLNSLAKNLRSWLPSWPFKETKTPIGVMYNEASMTKEINTCFSEGKRVSQCKVEEIPPSNHCLNNVTKQNNSYMLQEDHDSAIGSEIERIPDDGFSDAHSECESDDESFADQLVSSQGETISETEQSDDSERNTAARKSRSRFRRFGTRFTAHSYSPPREEIHRERCLSLRRFDRKKDKFENYLFRFELVAEQNGWDNKRKIQEIYNLLDHDMRLCIRDLEQCGILDDFTMLTKILSAEFTALQQSEAKRSLLKRTRGSNESLIHYASDLKLLVSLAYPKVAYLDRRNIVLDKFVSGLNSEPLKEHILYLSTLSV